MVTSTIFEDGNADEGISTSVSVSMRELRLEDRGSDTLGVNG